jgi:hypothetical protein
VRERPGRVCGGSPLCGPAHGLGVKEAALVEAVCEGMPCEGMLRACTTCMICRLALCLPSAWAARSCEEP